jgi:peptidoglycan hydrolase CwlO-like protein
MGYENKTAIIVGTFTKLSKKKDNLEKKLQELNLQVETLQQTEGDMLIVIDIIKAIDKTNEDLYIVNTKVDAIQQRINGGASLDGFLEEKTDVKEDIN